MSIESWNAWRKKRASSVTSAQGNLALIQTTWLNEGETFESKNALLDQPETVIATDLERKEFDGKVVGHGYRLWDSQSPAIKSFKEISAFSFNPEWVIEGTFKELASAKPVSYEFIRDNGGTRDLAVPGEITATIKGVEFHLHAFDDDGKLLLVFADKTNGTQTYSSGRFLFVEKVPGTNKVIIDFNRAFVPPCGFSIHYNCPLPPKENRFDFEVTAGEKNAEFRDGYSIY